MALQANSVSISVCRICLNANCKNKVKFEVESEWSRIFEYCVGLRITTDKAPLEFCGACAEKLKDYEKFKKRCLKSDILWKSTKPCEVKCNIQIKEEPMIEEYMSDRSYNDEDFDISNIQLKPNVNKIANHINLETKRAFNRDLIQNLKEEQDDKYYEEICIVEGPMTDILLKPIKKTFKAKKKYNIPKRRKYRNGLKLKRRKLQKPVKLETLTPNDEVTNNSEKPPKELESFDCGICDFTSTDPKNLKNHFIEHVENNDLSCKLCDYVGRDFADMAQHRHSHIVTNDKIYCPACLKRFNVRIGIEFHYRSVHLKKPGGLCKFCNKALTGYRTWKRHEWRHEHDEKYICDICGMQAKYRCSMITHLREHENIAQFVCDTCGKGFKRMSNMRSHIENVHTPSVPVLCTHCNRMFKNEPNLRIHMREVNKEKKYICDVCSKGYPSIATLKSHMFWHTGERPFSCEVCGSKYKAKSALKIHLRSHSGHKPYKCLLCDKGFISSHLLKRHSSVHTGVRSCKCLYCDRTFYSKSLMMAHCASKHKVEAVTNNFSK